MPNKILPRIIIVLIITSGLIASFSPAQAAEAENNAKYVIGPGDGLEISVWGHPEFGKQLNVRPDGWINLPLIGEVSASGTNPESLSGNIRQKLLRYIKDPKVSVIVSKFGSKKILVLGEVKKPGLYQYEAGITVFEALGMAEGYNKYAQLKSILVVRNPYSPKPSFYLASFHKVVHDGDVTKNVALQPGDIVYVPQNFIGNLGDFMDYFISRIRPAADSYFIYEIARKTH